MILKELNLIGFGKFNNKKIELKEGINLVFGENESGKSTIHNFIYGMFYGFIRPNYRRTMYTEELDRYKPWDSDRYAGIISFQYNGRQYRIEKEFSRTSGTTKLIDENTGEDITYRIDNGSRVLQPGVHFFGFNSIVFSNTISIKQLGCKTEKELANEVTDRLINVSQSLADDISVQNALSQLESKMDEIGTERASTKPYGKNLRAIEELEREKKEILAEKDVYESFLAEKEKLNDELLNKENNFKSLKDILRKIEIYEKAKKLEEAKKIKEEIGFLEKNTAELSSFSNLSMEDYNEAINLTNSISHYNNNLKENESELEETKKKLTSIEADIKDNGSLNMEEITNDYNQYEELEEERNNIIYNKTDNTIEFLKRDNNEHIKNVSKYKILQGVLGVLGIASLMLMLTVPNVRLYLSLLAAILLASFVFFGSKVNKLKGDIREINKKIAEFEENERKRELRLKEIEFKQEELLKKYNVRTKLEFKRLYDKLHIEHISKEENIKLYDELDKHKKSLIDKISELKVELENSKNRLEEIFLQNNVRNLDEFRSGLEKKNLYEKYMKELEAKKEILDKVLGQSTIETLLSELENEEVDESVKELNKQQIQEEIERCANTISDYKVQLGRIEENINNLEERISKLVEIEEALERKYQYKGELETEYKALELAYSTIEAISKEIHDEFAPDINNKVSKLIKKITEGKYNKIKIDDKLNIKVENPLTGSLINISDLSGGTIDQIYFSLRFSLIDSISENKLPLILDDCFIQYDDNRLKNILKFLTEISESRQVILFTCQIREKKFLEEIGADFNFISLS